MDQEGGEALVISLRLQSGEKFDGVPVADPAQSLAEFLDSALKQLEVRWNARSRWAARSRPVTVQVYGAPQGWLVKGPERVHVRVCRR